MFQVLEFCRNLVAKLMVPFFNQNSSVVLVFSFLKILPASLNVPQDTRRNEIIKITDIFSFIIFYKKTFQYKSQYA